MSTGNGLLWTHNSLLCTIPSTKFSTSSSVNWRWLSLGPFSCVDLHNLQAQSHSQTWFISTKLGPCPVSWHEWTIPRPEMAQVQFRACSSATWGSDCVDVEKISTQNFVNGKDSSCSALWNRNSFSSASRDLLSGGFSLQVERVIAAVCPDNVVVELCRSRQVRLTILSICAL